MFTLSTLSPLLRCHSSPFYPQSLSSFRYLLERFGQFYGYLDAVGDDDVLTENMLQSAMNLIITLASGNVTPDVMSTAGMLLVREHVDLAQILGGTSGQTTSFTQQRIPALLIKWTTEVDALRKAQVPVSAPM